MLNAAFFEELSNKIKEIKDKSPISDVEHNIRALLQGAFTKLELVSREEFDVQAAVLRDTKRKLEDMEKKLSQLESLLQNSDK